MRTVLVVDDEPQIAEIARDYLRLAGFDVIVAGDGVRALEAARGRRPDLIVLDLGLPGLDGLEVARTLRKESDVPIIMLTARVTEDDRLQGLEIGADDYVTKPFSPRELVARVRALLRRTGERRPATEQVLRFDNGRLCVDPERHLAVVEGQPVELTPSEFKLLLALARSPGRVFSRFELINRVQGHDYDGYERTIDAHIKNLRRKIEPDAARPQWVQTVHGVGYRLASAAP